MSVNFLQVYLLSARGSLFLSFVMLQTLQKQLGSRLSSKNAVTRGGKLLMKNKTGEDKAVLKKKLQDLEREWEKVCQLSVARQDKLENAYRKIGQFRYCSE